MEPKRWPLIGILSQFKLSGTIKGFKGFLIECIGSTYITFTVLALQITISYRFYFYNFFEKYFADLGNSPSKIVAFLAVKNKATIRRLPSYGVRLFGLSYVLYSLINYYESLL